MTHWRGLTSSGRTRTSSSDRRSPASGEVGVIPTSPHELDWYLQVGRDYDGGAVAGPESDALGATA